MNGVFSHFLWAILLAVPMLGCDRGPQPVEVSGKVSFHGKALAGGTIQFFPADGPFAGAMINGDGSYTMKLLPGSYHVAIQESIPLPENWKHGDPIPDAKPQLPRKFAGELSSGLTKEIEPGTAEMNADFDLQ